MALNLKTLEAVDEVNDSDLVPEGDRETSYKIRHITIEKNREVVREHTKKVPNRRTHQPDNVTDWEAVGDALLDYALVDWSGVVANGKSVPCTTENKMLLDGVRRAALLERAGMNEVQAAPERREQSFRAPA